MMEMSPKRRPPRVPATGSPSPKLVPTKAMVKPAKPSQKRKRAHFQAGMGSPRSLAQARTARITTTKRIPSTNQNKPELKICMGAP